MPMPARRFLTSTLAAVACFAAGHSIVSYALSDAPAKASSPPAALEAVDPLAGMTRLQRELYACLVDLSHRTTERATDHKWTVHLTLAADAAGHAAVMAADGDAAGWPHRFDPAARSCYLATLRTATPTELGVTLAPGQQTVIDYPLCVFPTKRRN